MTELRPVAAQTALAQGEEELEGCSSPQETVTSV